MTSLSVQPIPDRNADMEQRLTDLVGLPWCWTDVETRQRHAVQGVTPTRAVVAPATTDEISAVLALAHAEGLAVVPWGRGHAQHLGAPPTRADLVLRLERLAGVREWEPADLTVTVGAGTTLAALQATLAQAGLWLPFDPPGLSEATLGGLVATNASGPHRLRYGTLRDLLIGFQAVRPDGLVFRGGAKVVKNVTGYDLPRLLVGSLGTLAVLTELTFKLQPLPPARATLLADFGEPGPAIQAVLALLATPLRPVACDLRPVEAGYRLLVHFFDHPVPLARAIRDGASLCWSAGAQGVEAASDEAAVWPGPALSGPVVIRLATLPGHLAPLVAQVASVTTLWYAHAGTGLVRAALPSPSLVGPLRAAAEGSGGYLVVEQAPADWDADLRWGPPRADFPLMRALKQQFDPTHLLNPGRFVGGL